MSGELSASEALYGFCGWLTGRKERTIMSAHNNAAVVAERIDEFCKANGLAEPREGWNKRFVYPDTSAINQGEKEE